MSFFVVWMIALAYLAISIAFAKFVCPRLFQYVSRDDE